MPLRRLTRRHFVQSVTSASLAAPTIWTRRAVGKEISSANDRINLALIGNGMMGRGHLNRFLQFGDVQLVAVCELEPERRATGQQRVETHYSQNRKGAYRGCDVFSDFREVLARDDIDAVVIATPDHWHAIPCIQAAKAKKDIYCEKPLTLTIGEGRKIVDAVKTNKVVFQTGSQQRSEFNNRFRLAVELVRNGRIGEIQTVRVNVGGPAIACDLPEEELPPGLDWNAWIGPAAFRGYNQILCPQGVHKHFPAFRRYREFASGPLGDMGAHHFDIAQWALNMDRSGPVKIEPPDDNARSGLKFTYANGIEMHHGGSADCTLEGTEGTIHVSRGSLKSDPEKIVQEPLGTDAWTAYPSSNHARNWIDCIRSREETICPAEIGQRSAAICHLANIGYWLRRPLEWDPETEQFVNDEEADQWLLREPRSPWSYD
ncbi:MAG: Gfo/Idh/MocA family oxidoreductase [Pirellulaceae bacterium]|nr:Gfo/Idh/MocA family oxidoreductase [Pirellulaceae bacterium]